MLVMFTMVLVFLVLTRAGTMIVGVLVPLLATYKSRRFTLGVAIASGYICLAMGSSSDSRRKILRIIMVGV